MLDLIDEERSEDGGVDVQNTKISELEEGVIGEAEGRSDQLLSPLSWSANVLTCSPRTFRINVKSMLFEHITTVSRFGNHVMKSATSSVDRG